MRSPDPIVTIPDPTPPWVQPQVQPSPAAPAPVFSWARVYESAPRPDAVEATPETVEPAAAAADAVVADVALTEADDTVAEVEPVEAMPALEDGEHPLPPRSVSPVVETKALSQTFTSTVRPSPFLSSMTSTLSAPAFRFETEAIPVAKPMNWNAPTPTPSPEVVKGPSPEPFGGGA